MHTLYIWAVWVHSGGYKKSFTGTEKPIPIDKFKIYKTKHNPRIYS